MTTTQAVATKSLHAQSADQVCADLETDPARGLTKFMATFHHDGERVRMLVKGAPDVLLARASSFLDAAGELPLDDPTRAAFAAENAAFAGQMRVLAVASHEIPAQEFNPSD